MKRFVGILACMAAMAAPASAQTVTIDFEGFAETTPATDLYAADGVTFYLVGSSRAPFIATEGLPQRALVTSYPTTIYDVAVSGVNTMTDGTAGAEYGAEFAEPVSDVSLALVDFGDCVSGVPMGQPVTATLNGYNAAGVLVASDSYTTPRFGGGTPQDGAVVYLSMSGPGIVRVETSGVSADCGTAIDDFTFTIEDSDGDGVPDGDDMCPGTAASDADAGVPARRLGVNRWADVDGDGVFDTTLPAGQGPQLSFTMEDTAGCNCAQIIEELDLGEGHVKFGCSISAMRDWTALVEANQSMARTAGPGPAGSAVMALDGPEAAACSASRGNAGLSWLGLVLLGLAFCTRQTRRRSAAGRE